MAPKASTVLIFFLVLLSKGGVARARKHKEPDGEAEWTYRLTSTTGKQPYGPRLWDLVNPDCGGDSQSPINIAANRASVVRSSRYDMEVFSKECFSNELSFLPSEESWKVDFKGCSSKSHLLFDGDKYNLAQLHIHSPSEHTIGGSTYAAEIHFVHVREDTDDDLLVVGVLFHESEYGSNAEIQQLWDVLSIGEETTDENLVTEAYSMLPPNPTFLHYMGSLTTPPCTEGVKWVVMSDALVMSKAQLQSYRTSIAFLDDSKVDERGNTNRPVQPLNDRELVFVKP